MIKKQNGIGVLADGKIMLFVCDKKLEDMTVAELMEDVEEQLKYLDAIS